SGVVLQTVQQLYNEWLGTDHAISEGERGMRNIAAFIERYGDSRFQYENRDRIVNDRAGWCRHNNNNEEYLYHFTVSAFTEACNGISAKLVQKELVKHSFLCFDNGRTTSRIRTQDGQQRVISVKSVVLEKMCKNSIKSGHSGHSSKKANENIEKHCDQTQKTVGHSWSQLVTPVTSVTSRDQYEKPLWSQKKQANSSGYGAVTTVTTLSTQNQPFFSDDMEDELWRAHIS
ncbi:MAG: hypothetical protein R8L53_02855, partial [Mariprofundales bacterium]